MSENIKNYGVEIILNDLDIGSIATEDIDTGLYNRSSTNSELINIGDTVITLNDVSSFNKNDVIKLDFGASNEYWNVITEINYTDDEITLLNSSPGIASPDSLNVRANSVFRWIQSPITGLSGWQDSVLLEGGIGEFTKKINLKKGGSVEEPGKCKVAVNNTNYFFNILEANGIRLLGKTCNIYSFENTSKTKRWSGYCENPSWNTVSYNIPVTGRYNKRNAFLGRYIDSKNYPNASSTLLGNMIPLTFGKFLPDYDSDGNIIYSHFSRFVRIADKIDVMNLELGDYTEVAENLSIKTTLIGGGDQFPIVSEQTDKTYTYMLKPSFSIEAIIDETHYTSGTEDVTDKFSNTFLKVTEGKGKDEVRKINSFVLDLDSNVFQIGVSDVFENTLAGNSTATATDNSWASIVTVYKKYACDFWPMKKFIDMETGEDIETEPNLAVYNSDEERYNQIPKYGYEIDTGDSDLNKLKIDLKFYNEGYNNLTSYLDLPVKYFYPYDKDDLADFGHDTYNKKLQPGVYSYENWQDIIDGSSVLPSSPENIYDRDFLTDDDTSLTFRYLGTGVPSGQSVWFYHAVSLQNFPKLPANFSFDSVYLGLKMKTDWGATSSTPASSTYNNETLEIYWKRWIGSAESIYEDTTYDDTFSPTGYNYGELHDLPAFHFTGNPPEGNEKFFFDKITSSEIYGYSNYELSGINNDNYSSLDEINILLKRKIDHSMSPPIWLESIIKCYEACLLFKKSYDIKEKLYSTNEGRTYNDTWGGRVTSTEMIESPVSILEHICRLQNWSECNINPTEDTWGKTYAENALILTGTEEVGSYDYESSRLEEIKNLKCSRQILDSGEAYSNKLKMSLCRNFFLASFTDKDGYERIDSLLESDTDPSDEITFGDIIDRKSISVEEPSPMNIYPEPFVNFQYDPEADSYQNIISISNTGAKDLSDEEKESFVVGLSGAEAIEYWNRCASLWGKTNQRNDPPSDLTDLKWANGEDAEDIAKIYLKRWINWMSNPSIKFKTPSGKVEDWELVKRFKLTLPFHTKDISNECIVSSKKINPNTGIAEIEAVILRNISESEPFSIIDVINSLPESSDNWDDKIDEQIDSDDNLIDTI